MNIVMAEGESEGAVGRNALERESAMGGPQFSPPLYRQRYEAVRAACRRLHAAKVASHMAKYVHTIYVPARGGGRGVCGVQAAAATE
jgi:hypothetical protein